MMKKPEYVKIVSIVVKPDNTGLLYGLGDDNLVYLWIPSDHTWQLWG